MPKEYDLQPALKRFVEPSEVDRPWIGLVRDFAKMSFDFLRNLLIVGSFKYLSDKTGNAYAQVAFYFASSLLLLLTYSYIALWNLCIFQNFRIMQWRRVGEFVDVTINVLLSVGLFAVSVQGIFYVTDAIVQSHAP